MAAVLFYVQSLLHGVFASGFVPILRQTIVDQAALAFALYFGGLVAGQLAIVSVPALRRPRLAYVGYEVFFGLTLAGMGLWFRFLPGSLLLGRFLEGVAGGLALPLLFQWVTELHEAGSASRRVALFNSLFALGFVVGPPLVEAGLAHTGAPALLVGFGAVFIVLALPLAALLGPVPPEPPSGGPPVAWMDTFYLLFLGKCAYGFILPWTTQVLADRLPFSVAWILNLLAAVFVVGQWVGGVVVTRLGRAPLETVLPLILAPFIVALAIPGLAWAVFPGGLVHSVLMFVALRNVARTPGSARQFALVSSLSDPGLVLGASLAALGGPGVAGVALLSVVPLGRRVLVASRAW